MVVSTYGDTGTIVVEKRGLRRGFILGANGARVGRCKLLREIQPPLSAITFPFGIAGFDARVCRRTFCRGQCR